VGGDREQNSGRLQTGTEDNKKGQAPGPAPDVN
jgi:hypothetical protein